MSAGPIASARAFAPRPRDALVADSVTPEIRGLAFGFHRAMDTAGALLGILIAVVVVWRAQQNHARALKIHLSDPWS